MSRRLLQIRDWETLAKESKFQPGIMAARCPISLRQLERFFTEYFKKTPRIWAKELQMRIALTLILQGWKNKAVVAELGFGNQSQLCHDFKRFYGSSPQTFAPLYKNPVLNGGRLNLLSGDQKPTCRVETRMSP